jgi:DNA-binding NarL/FixJ family response regulator
MQKRVLIVEDEPIVALNLEDMVESLGFTVVGSASRLDHGLQLARNAAPDLAILDVNLHGEKSYPIADLLADNGVPYFFATGYGSAGHPERHRRALTVAKPYSESVIADAIATVSAAARNC